MKCLSEIEIIEAIDKNELNNYKEHLKQCKKCAQLVKELKNTIKSTEEILHEQKTNFKLNEFRRNKIKNRVLGSTIYKKPSKSQKGYQAIFSYASYVLLFFFITLTLFQNNRITDMELEIAQYKIEIEKDNSSTAESFDYEIVVDEFVGNFSDEYAYMDDLDDLSEEKTIYILSNLDF